MSQDLDFSSYFQDSVDVSSQLLDTLPQLRMQNDDWLIVATNERAVLLANMISLKLNLDFDILFNEPIMAPNNDKCEIAIVSEIEEIVIDEALLNSFEINLDYVYGQARRLYEEKIIPRIYKFRKGELIDSLKDRNVLFVDFGCETGFNVISCVKSAIKTEVKSVMYATPVMAQDVYESLELVTDEIFCVKRIENYVNVDFYYKKMQKVSQDDIIEILNNAKGYLPFVKNRSDDGI
ncbi:MAG: sodium:proton antiporter [Sulfurospirillum sp.]